MPEQADRFRQPDEEGGADDRPEEVARTADQRHEDDVAGAQPIDRVDRNDAVDQPVERPGQAGERAGDNEAGPFVAAHVMTGRRGARRSEEHTSELQSLMRNPY